MLTSLYNLDAPIPSMFTQEYRNNGIIKLLKYQDKFYPGKPVVANKTTKQSKDIESFISTFCEFQLADNDYMNLQVEARQQKDNKDWFKALSEEKVLKLITYIIWTDKFVDGYFSTRISDGTIHELLMRLHTLQKPLPLS